MQLAQQQRQYLYMMEHLSQQYPENLWKFLNKAKIEILLMHWSTDHALDLELGDTLLNGEIFNVSKLEL
jgi:hypothetical protein